MSAPDLAAARAALLARRAELEALAAGTAGERAPVELDQARVGRLSRMDALQVQAMAQETERRRALALQRIASALARIDSGDYGRCVRCDEPIEPGRLRLDPATPTCIGCANG
ncbi:MAG: TraR/DksA C4-type zinc finger protein [Alphaproteobacteria bacterium]